MENMIEKKENNNILSIANNIQYNLQKEADAIRDYTDLLNMTKSSDIDEEQKKHIFDVIGEIIADELNHQQKLVELYTKLTTIQANLD